eukprot:TRINITY_DN5244_c0_g1_i1.p1 TRINITY_DN5244_c0_g1~~TRINITY_DN5244_c0_g1_i1.p1  ORF type:complete len:461 (-),score=108.22 TRINITY_DN5244_c0_g1_i1:181-1506(-)
MAGKAGNTNNVTGSTRQKRVQQQQRGGNGLLPFTDVTNLFEAGELRQGKPTDKATTKPAAQTRRAPSTRAAGLTNRFHPGTRTATPALGKAEREAADTAVRSVIASAAAAAAAATTAANLTLPPQSDLNVFADAVRMQLSERSDAFQKPAAGFGRAVSGDVDMSPRTLSTPRRLAVSASSDPQAVGEYAVDIFERLSTKERADTCQPEYMERQRDINSKMRAILIDWLVEVHLKYKMRAETLLLTVSIIDRYLAKCQVSRKRLQLVGVSSLLIAAKFEEIHPPEVKELAYITDNAYSKAEILDMEVKVLCSLGFQICIPTASHFLDTYATANEADEEQRYLIQYIVELALPEIGMLKHKPSHLVAAACLLSNKLMARSAMSMWSAQMRSLTSLSELALQPCAKELEALLEQAASGAHKLKLQAVWKKFSQRRFRSVATRVS